MSHLNHLQVVANTASAGVNAASSLLSKGKDYVPKSAAPVVAALEERASPLLAFAADTAGGALVSLAVELARKDLQDNLQDLQRDLPGLDEEIASRRREQIMAKLRRLAPGRSATVSAVMNREGRIVADHLRERASLRVFWIQAAGEIPAEAAESLGHRMPLGALLVARAITEIAGADALLLLVDERLKLSPEATEHIAPISAAFGNGVELLLHASGEAEVNERGEVRRE